VNPGPVATGMSPSVSKHGIVCCQARDTDLVILL
jgi:hypothetical protein